MAISRLAAITCLLSVSGCSRTSLDANNPAHCLAALVTVINLAKGHPAERDGGTALLNEAAAFEIFKAKSEGRFDAVERESESAAKQMINNPDLSYTLAEKCGRIVFADPAEKAFARTRSGS